MAQTSSKSSSTDKKTKSGAESRKKRRLGRGLGSLISDPVRIDVDQPTESSEGGAPPPPQDDHQPPAATPTPASHRDEAQAGRDTDDDVLVHLLIEQIQPNARQPRQHFDQVALNTLADSIRTAGLMQPIVVRPTGDADGRGQPRYELIAGERRWRAAQQIGLDTIPAVVRDINDRQAAEWSLIENLQREDLNPMERAQAFQRLIDEFGMTHQEVAECVGLQRSSVTNHLRLLELDEQSAKAVAENLISLGHAKALLSSGNLKRRHELLSKTVREGWSVRALEREVQRQARADASAHNSSGGGNSTSDPAAREGDGVSAHLADLSRRLGEHLGTRTHIEQGKKKGAGKLVLEFYDLKQFEGLLERLGFTAE